LYGVANPSVETLKKHENTPWIITRERLASAAKIGSGPLAPQTLRVRCGKSGAQRSRPDDRTATEQVLKGGRSHWTRWLKALRGGG
jgi:hypothetical protein